VALDGSHLRRRFIVMPAENGGGVADGLASDGAHLYFSRCQDDAIGRADLDGSHLVQQFFSIGPHQACPQGIAIAGGHVYWTQLGSGMIGRAALDGGGADSAWLDTGSGAQGPFQIVADNSHIYWTWGGAYRTPNYTGRADADGSHVQPRFLTDSLYPMALSPPAEAALAGMCIQIRRSISRLNGREHHNQGERADPSSVREVGRGNRSADVPTRRRSGRRTRTPRLLRSAFQ
jgi:hypothetical protein